MSRLPRLLFGRGVFAPVHHILEELPFEKVGDRPSGMPHSIFEELWHLDYWQRYLLARARGERPSDGEEWPPSAQPADTDAWSELLERIRLGLDEAAGMAADAEVMDREVSDGGTVRGAMEDLVAHNSYHWARVVALRQLMGLWPPHGIG
ncbi:MAG TPA: DinB family protein [Trueperaceae bacterium]